MRLKQTPRNKKEEHRRIAETLPRTDKTNKKAVISAEKEATMSKSTTKIVITTVGVTLAIIGSIVGAFIVGINYQKSINDRVLNEAHEIVKLKQ